MIKIKLLNFVIWILCFSIFIIPNVQAYQADIAEKYDNIFSAKILSDEDVKNYQQLLHYLINIC